MLVAGAPKAGFAAPKSPPPAAGWAVEPKAPVEPKAGAAEVAVAPKPPGNKYYNEPSVSCESRGPFSIGGKLLDHHTVCPRSSDPFYIVTNYIKWVTTSWTHSTLDR